MIPQLRPAAVLGTPDPRGLARSYRDLLGAQTSDDEDVAVHADPAGHPFCLFAAFR